MKYMARRRLLRLSGIGALTAASGGLAGILASGRAPVFAQGTTLHWVRGSDYVPVSDQTLRTKILEQCQKDLGIKFNLETVDGLTIQARSLPRSRPAPVPTSSARSTIGRSSTPTASPTSATSRRKLARRKAAITKPRRRSPMTAKSGLPSRIRLSACRSPTAPRGGTRSATGRKNIQKPGRNGAKPAKS